MRRKDLSERKLIMCDRCGRFEYIHRDAEPDPEKWKMVYGFRLCTECEWPKPKKDQNGMV